MTHLKPDALVRLVDEPPAGEDREHLTGCRRCRDELRALKEQRRVLAGLPEVAPPAEAWDTLEARLRNEALIAEEAPGEGRSPRSTGQRSKRPAPWLQAAAAVVLFAGGAMVGAATRGGLEEAPFAMFATPEDALRSAEQFSLAEAQELVSVTHRWHLDAILLYRDRLERVGGTNPVADPVARFVAIEHLLSATEAAVRENPADPFLNGMLVSATAERRVALDGISLTSTDGP